MLYLEKTNASSATGKTQTERELNCTCTELQREGWLGLESLGFHLSSADALVILRKLSGGCWQDCWTASSSGRGAVDAHVATSRR